MGEGSALSHGHGKPTASFTSSSRWTSEPSDPESRNRMHPNAGRDTEILRWRLPQIKRCVAAKDIRGYQPRFNLQMSLAEAVSRWLAKNLSFEASNATMVAQRFVDTRALPFSSPPTMTNAPPSAELSQLEAIARRFDVAGRDERNRSLGKAGEERVFHHERTHLQASGRSDLADKVRWASQEDGDGAG
jgi:hypothetical protein